MPKVDFLKLKQDLTLQIANYQLSAVASTIRNLSFKDIPSDLVGEFARLARQAHLYKEALEILHDHIHGARKPSAPLLLEYASSLRRLGMINQCLQLLKRFEHPEKYLHEAYCHIHRWDYQKASVCLTHFLNQKSASERETLVAQLNLISCQIFTKEYDKATQLISAISPLCETKYFQFFLNLLEMKGQIHIHKQETALALEVLNKAASLSSQENGHTSLFIEKWKLVAEIQGGEFNPDSISTLKKKIRSQGHWESLRDLDYHLAVATKNQNLTNVVFFGSPHTDFKKRISESTPLSQSYLFMPHKNEKVTAILDPFDTQMPLAAFGLIQHRLLLILISDIYRPQTVYSLFDALFPEDIYDPASSPKRVYALIQKLQKSLKEICWPFELQATTKGYRFRAKPGGAIILYDNMVFTDSEEILHYSLKNKYKLNHFTPKELSEVLHVSSHKAYRWIQAMEEKNIAEVDLQSRRIHLKAG